MESMIRAEVLDESGNTVAATTHRAPLVIGADASADLRVQGAGVGPTQVRVGAAPGGGFLLRQLDDANPTLVGSLLLSEAETPSPVSLSLGTVSIRLSRTDPAEVHATERKPGGTARVWGLYAACIALIGGHAYAFDYTDAPGEEATVLTVGLVILTLAWAAAWAIGNRLFRHPLSFARHLQVTATFSLIGVGMAWFEEGVLASLHLPGLGAFLNWTVWGVWGCAFLASHMAIAGRWGQRKRWVVAGAIYYGLFGLATLAPTDSTPMEQVKSSLLPLGYLPTWMYVTSSSDVLGEDAAELVAKVRELPSEQVVRAP